MRIISPYHDYYDGVMSYGHDESVIYHRVPNDVVELVHKHDLPPQYRSMINVNNALRDDSIKPGCSVYYHLVTVLFCGKLYGGLGVHLSNFYIHAKDVKFFAYSVDQLKEFCKKFKFEIPDEILDQKFHRWTRNTPAENSLREHLSLDGKVSNMELAINSKSPIILVKKFGCNYTVTENPNLNDIQFFRAVDAFTAFQELDMFIGGILAPENRQMVTIDDKYKIQEHGFDKWSFRKMPTK